MPGCIEHGNETSDSIKGREVFDKMSDYQLLKKECARSLITYLFCSCTGLFYVLLYV
jgi:hypothetical protein